MRYNNTMFPSQKLPINKKDERWRESCVDYIAGMSTSAPAGEEGISYEEMQTLYDLYNGIFDPKDLKYVTDPFNQEDGFPANPQNFNRIRPVVDLLLGEEMRMPFNFKVARTSSSAVSDAQDQMKSMLMDYVMSSILAEMTPEGAAEFQEKLATGEIMPPEKLATFMTKDYKDIIETSAMHALNYLKENLNLQNEFNKGMKDALIAAKEVYFVGVQNGEPHMEKVNPLYFSHDYSPDVEYIEDGDWACRKMRMSVTEIYDRLYDKLSEKDLNKLLDMMDSESTSVAGGKDAPMLDYNHTKFRSIKSGEGIADSGNHIDLWHATWKSFKKVGFVIYMDEYGQPQQTIVSEDYMEVGTEISVEWKWIIEVWEGYKIGSDMYVGIEPLAFQHMSKDNLNSQKLPYVGIIYNNTNSKPKSLVSVMKSLQYMYIIIWYRLELALARDKGKVITMDITQIPKSMNIDAAKWMHYLSSVGVNFINPYEEGWDIPGREGGKPAQFNQMAALDLTMADVIDQYINLMSKIEDMIGEISGVTKQRQGSVSNRELVGSVERAVVQSSLVTEPIFWAHNQCKRNVLRQLLNTAKEAWRVSGRNHLQYIYDDATRAFLTLSEDFFYEECDIFVTDSNKESTNIEMIKSLYQPAMQNGTTLLDVAEIMTLDNVSEIKNTLAKIEVKREEQLAKQAEQEQAAQQQAIETQNQVRREEMALKEQELLLNKYKTDVDNQTRIITAEISAYRFQQDLDANNNNIPDPMEIADASLKQMQFNADVEDKNMQANIKNREFMAKTSLENKKIENQKEIESRKIKLEEDKMKHAESLQKLKDTAALERERLKAKTALKNKVVGER